MTLSSNNWLQSVRGEFILVVYLEGCSIHESPSPPLLVSPRTDIMRLLTYYVHVVECLLYTAYKQNPNQIVLKKVLRLKGHLKTPCDAYAKRLESHYVVVLDIYETLGRVKRRTSRVFPAFITKRLCYCLRNTVWNHGRGFFSGRPVKP